MGRKPNRVPVIRTHKGRDRCWRNGRWHDLGPSGSPAALAEYARLVALWAADPAAPALDPADLLFAELLADHADSDAVPPGRKPQARVFARLFLETYLSVAVADFAPKDLDAWMRHLARPEAAGGKGFNTTYVTMARSYLCRAVAWGVVHRGVPVAVGHGLALVPPLPAGTARPKRRVTAAGTAAVDAALPRLPAGHRDALELIRLTGMRPGDCVAVRPCDVARGGVVPLPDGGEEVDLTALGVWLYVRPDGDGKSARFGTTRYVVLGAESRAILAPRLDAALDRDGPGGWAFPAARTPGAHLCPHVLARTLRRVTRRLGLTHFAPYQLRHQAIRRIDRDHGRDAARAAGGHAGEGITGHYARTSFAAAAKAAR